MQTIGFQSSTRTTANIIFGSQRHTLVSRLNVLRLAFLCIFVVILICRLWIIWLCWRSMHGNTTEWSVSQQRVCSNWRQAARLTGARGDWVVRASRQQTVLLACACVAAQPSQDERQRLFSYFTVVDLWGFICIAFIKAIVTGTVIAAAAACNQLPIVCRCLELVVCVSVSASFMSHQILNKTSKMITASFVIIDFSNTVTVTPLASTVQVATDVSWGGGERRVHNFSAIENVTTWRHEKESRNFCKWWKMKVMGLLAWNKPFCGLNEWS